MNLTDNVILITGGASGIGYALAERFTQLGNRVIICGRRADALADAEAKLPGLVTKQVDLSSSAERESLARWIESEHPGLNVLVNNAGIQQWMSVTDTDFADRATTEITTNIEAPVHLTSLFLALPNLKVVMNVTSGLAFSPLATVPVYSATKAFFRSFTLSLRHQLRSRGIEVIELIPPALNTDLGGKGIHDFAPPVSGFIDSAFEQLAAGKHEIAYGFSEQMLAAGPSELRQAFERMNPAG
ncbi:MAG: SDR family NAD(P)-dependent oxidoreductase [Bacteroidetes bacterium]|nr:SDR family NAD(P)-dependent oxidoreductase [Bacteroidota bacterium]